MQTIKKPWLPGYLLVALLAAPIFVGPFLAWWFDDSVWMWGLGFIIFFMS